MIGDFAYKIDDQTPRGDIRKWAELVSKSGCSVEFLTRKPNPNLKSNWRHLDFGNICINYIHNFRSFCAVHEPNLKEGGLSRKFKLIFTDTRAILRHYDRVTVVPASSFVLIDSTYAFEFEIYEERSIGISLNLDPNWLLKYIPNPKLSVAHPVSTENDWANMLLLTLETIEKQQNPENTIPRSLIADQLGSLLSLLFLPEEGVRLNTRHQVSLYSKLERILHEDFHLPDLNPDAVARKAGISRRHLFNIYSKAGSTFNHELLNIRLDNSHKMFLDERYSAYRICDVAWACGFSDQGLFGRKFKERYGCTPTVFRKRAISEQQRYS